MCVVWLRLGLHAKMVLLVLLQCLQIIGTVVVVVVVVVVIVIIIIYNVRAVSYRTLYAVKLKLRP